MSFIDAHRARFGVEPICRILDVAPSTFYARRSRPPSRRAVEDGRLLGRIRDVHATTYAAYGSRRTWKTLRRQGDEVGRGRVERVMRQHGLQGAQRQAKKRWLTRADEAAPRPADLVERHFVAHAPNQLWVCDLTYLKTYEGFLYLATASVGSVADAYDNAMAESFVGTLKAALVQGRPFRTRFEAELAVAKYLGWFNHTRLHSSLDDLSPTQFEIDHHPNKNRTEPLPANP